MKRKTFQKIFVLIQTNTPCRQQMTTKLATSPAAQPELFRGQGRFLYIGAFRYTFHVSHVQILVLSPQDTLKTAF